MRLLKMVGLMVKHNDRMVCLQTFCQISQTMSATVGCIVASDNIKGIVNQYCLVDKRFDMAALKEVDAFVGMCVIVVVAQATVYAQWSVETAQLTSEIVSGHRPTGEIYYIASDKNNVGMFCVDEINPPRQFLGINGVTQVEVADENNLIIVS